MKIDKVILFTILLLVFTIGIASATLNVYPVTAISDTKIIPKMNMGGYTSGTSIQMNMCPGEIRSSSFVVNSTSAINSFTVIKNNLVGSGGTISSANIDLKWVKCWWQAGNTVDNNRINGKYLTPELLLNDDTLISATLDTSISNPNTQNTNGQNSVKTTNGSYMDVSDPTPVSDDPLELSLTQFPVQDASTFTAMNLPANYNKQVWVTVNVPNTTTAGTYTGNLTLSNGAALQNITFTVSVSNFTLPVIENSVYYTGFISHGSITNAYKTTEQFTNEQTDFAKHNVNDPTLYVPSYYVDDTVLIQEMQIRQAAGLDNTNLYLCWSDSDNVLSNDVTKIPHFKSILAPYGVKNIYYYGPDEAPMNRTMVQNVLNAGGSYFDTVPSDQAAAAADILPLEVYSVPPDPTIAATYHSYGHRIYSYFNPQSVPEFPRTMRLNYGLLLWQNNFDGAMTYAYQDGAGSIWNDFDAADTFRDHNFAYPTVNGVIDTVQWEGYRDGCTDRQYVKALQNAIASRPANPTSLLANNYLSGLKSTSLTATDLDSTVSTISNYAATIYASANSSNEVGIVTYQNNTSLNFSTTYNASYVKTINTTVSPIHNISSPANISGLVAWYKFDEASGTNIINYANSSNNGTLDGTTYTRVAGKYNNAVNFNGDGENRMSYNDPVLGKTAFTVIGWANKKGSSFYNFNNIIGDYGNTTNWMLIENPAGTADFYIGDGTVGSVKATTQGGWTNNSWHMISGRYSQASDLAITGVDLNFTSQVLDGYVTNIGTVQSDNCYVGFWHDNWQAFNGSLDQIMIYNRSLTDSEIQDIYYSQIANLTVKTNSNSTQSSKINGGGTTTVPFAHTDAGINALTFAVPSSVIINGTTINDYQNTVSPLLVNVSITNIDLAVASFTSNVTSGIAPLVVQFNDTSTGSQLSWNWYFGDGTSNATTQNVTHTYSTPGTYSVVLTTSNSIGKSTANTVITVNKITPTITWSNPANITYGTALSSTQQNAYVTGISGALSFSPAPGTILAAGNYNLTVTFTPSNLTLYSIVTKTVPLTVNKATPTIAWSNPANITYGTALSSTQLNAIASVPGNKTYTPPLNSIISIGTQNLHVDFTPTDSTNYTTASKDVTINVVDVGPIANFSLIPNSGNIPLTVAFTSTSTGYPTSYQWNFGDGTANDTTVSPTHVYNKCGIFNVTLTVSNTAGSNTKTVTSAVTVRPTANFTGTPTNGNTPLTVQFTDSSLGTPTSWNWNFGDGQSSNTSSPSHQYSSAGTYTVILTVTNAGGSDIITRSNYITASLSAPMAAFTASPLSGQSPLTVQFTDQSTNSPTSWNWDFGDGQTSSSQNPSHIYTVSTTTTFIVKLTATNAAGNNTLTKSSYITVSKGVVTPVANFTANVTTGLSPMNVKFTDQSTNSPTSWSWTFGDGNTSTSQNPTHLYVGNGLRTVSLTATNSNGSNTVTKTSYINVTSSLLKPVPKFTSDKRFGATPLTVNFTDQSTNSPNSWAWNFGDGTTNSTQNPSHVYSKTGIFSVSMVSANGAGTGNVFTKYSYIWVYPNWGIALTFPLFEGVPA